MKQKKSRISVKISLYIAIMQVLVMFFLFLYISISVTGNMKQTAIDTMQTISADRAKIIEDYILSSEAFLTAYSRAGRSQTCCAPRTTRKLSPPHRRTRKHSVRTKNISKVFIHVSGTPMS